MSLLQFLNFFYTSFNFNLYGKIKIFSNSQNNIIIFQGTKGFLIIHVNLFKKALYTTNTIYLKMFINYFQSLLFGIEFLFKKVLLIKGVGYKFEIKQTKQDKISFLKLKAGYNSYLVFKFKNTKFLLKTPRVTRVLIKSNSWNNLYKFMEYIRKYRLPNVYTGKGFFTRYKKPRRKLVVKTTK